MSKFNCNDIVRGRNQPQTRGRIVAVTADISHGRHPVYKYDVKWSHDDKVGQLAEENLELLCRWSEAPAVGTKVGGLWEGLPPRSMTFRKGTVKSADGYMRCRISWVHPGDLDSQHNLEDLVLENQAEAVPTLAHEVITAVQAMVNKVRERQRLEKVWRDACARRDELEHQLDVLKTEILDAYEAAHACKVDCNPVYKSIEDAAKK